MASFLSSIDKIWSMLIEKVNGLQWDFFSQIKGGPIPESKQFNKITKL